jgi:hypothetical protein
VCAALLLHFRFAQGGEHDQHGTWQDGKTALDTALNTALDTRHRNWQVYVLLLASFHGHLEVASVLEAAQPETGSALPATEAPLGGAGACPCARFGRRPQPGDA